MIQSQLIRKRRSWRAIGAALGLFAALSPARAEVTGQWDFNTGSLNATKGEPLAWLDGEGGATQLATQFGSTASFSIPDINGAPAQVMRAPKNTSAMGVLMRPGLPSNGGGSLANQYSLVFDILSPAGSMSKARSLVQIDDPSANLNEADISINAGNGVGAGLFQGALQTNTWHRVVVTVDLAATPPVMTKYIDGVKAGSENLSSGIDGRWAMNDKAATFGIDAALLFSSSTSASEVLFLNSLQVHDTVLSANYVAALGGAQAAGIPAFVTPKSLLLDLQPAPGAAYVFPNTALTARLLEGAQPVNRSTIRLFVDGLEKTPQIISPAPGELLISHDPGLLPPSSIHQAEIRHIEPSTGAEVSSGVWNFTLAPYNLPPIDLVTDSLVYMPFDLASATHGQAVPDSSAQANNGVLTVDAADGDLLIDGRIGKAIDFRDDSVNYVALEKPWAAIPNTFAVWVKLPTTIPDGTRPGVIVGSYDRPNNINWEVTTSGQARIYWNGGNPNWVVSGTDLRTGEWEHMAFVRDPAKSQIRFYLNGRLHSTLGTIGAEVNPNSVSWIGADLRASGTPHFRGAIDEVVIFNRPFSDEEIWRIYARAFDFPDFTFPVPQVVSVSPANGATLVAPASFIAAQIDEVNSSAKVDRSSIVLTVNGQPRAVTLEDVGGLLRVQAQASPVLAAATYTNRLTFNLTPPTGGPVEKTWTFATAPLPTISAQPASQRVVTGSSASFRVTAVTTPPASYQWRHSGTNLPGATNSVFAIAVTTAADAGVYDVVVSDVAGSVTSNAARLDLDPALPSDPAESLRYSLSAHWPFDTNFASQPAGFDGTSENGASIAADARVGSGSLNLDQASSQWVRVSQRVIPDGALTYTVAGWFKVRGGTGRRFLWETTPNYSISTEITPAGTLKAFTLLANGSGPNADTLIAPPPEEWHHAAVTFDSVAGVATIYYDGQLSGATFALAQGVGASTTTGFHIGTYRNGDARFYDGLIDDVAVWTRVLNAEEIAWLAGGNVVPPPLPPSAEPIVIAAQPQDQTTLPHSSVFLSVAASAASPLGYQWRRGNEVIAGATATNLVAGDLTAAADFSVVITDGAQYVTSRVARVEVQALPAAPKDSVPLGLTASWAFDQDFASSSAAHHGAAMGGAAIVPGGKLGGAVRLSQASRQHVSVPAPVIRDGTLTYTVAGWMNLAGGAGRRFLWETAAANYPISTEITPAGTLKAFTRQSNLNGPNQDTLIVVPQNEWHHVAVTFNSVLGKAYVYYDGTLAGDGFDLTPNLGTAPTTGFNIGTFRSANDRFFEGLLDDVGVWGRVLSTEEIQWLAAGNPILPALAPQIEVTAVTLSAAGATITWQGGTGPFQVQHTDALGEPSATQWINLGPATNGTTATDPALTGRRFYRIIGQ